ncbi:nucleoprotein [Lone star tick rhabdovirus]|uniref:Nucleoprotein n=1 Tax=Lone star tick rhabdovirus TaxID=1756186 RepID=A0A1N7TF61_9RHAB|nr:nucleoprotein [Lone star tick rhabdovirus]ALO28651.1 nucleoprotein [Lone star tick rhabdovirus]
MELWPVNVEKINFRPIVTPVTTETAPTYPSVWFDAHANQKPGITARVGEANLAYHNMIIMLEQQQWTELTVVSYMVAVIRENPNIFSTVPTAAWAANGRPVARANQRVSVLDILTVTNGAAWAAVQQARASTRESRLSLFWATLLLYRKTLAREVDREYGNKIARQLNDFFKGGVLQMDVDDTEEDGLKLGKDKLKDGYLKLVAAIDMFFFKYQDHEYSMVRMATLPSRFKGCAAITSAGQVAKILGIEPGELGLFVYTEPVAVELANSNRPNQGMEDLYGYFPYQMDMGMTQRSAYSISSNPTLYLWLHTIGCTVGFQRSFQARYPEAAGDISGTMISAAAVGLAFSKGLKMRRQFGTTEEAANALRARNQAIDQAEAAAAEVGEEAPPPPPPAQEGVEAVADGGDGEGDAAALDIPPPPAEENPLAAMSNTILDNLIENEGLTKDEMKEFRRRLILGRTLRETTVGRRLANIYNPGA